MPQHLPGKLLEAVSSLPPLPSSVAKLITLTSDMSSDTREISKVISADEVLTSRILRLVNSASFGLPNRVTSISQAIMILGFENIKELAISFSMVDFLSKKMESLPLDRDQFWRHSIGVACSAKMIGRSVPVERQEEMFTAGLLHDIGKVVFMTHFTQKYQIILETLKPEKKLIVAQEKDILGFDHSTLGREVCLHWNMPHYITRVVDDHHRTPNQYALTDEESKCVAAVHFADNLTKLAGIGDSGDPFIHKNFLKALTIGLVAPNHLYDTALRLVGEVRNYETLFGIKPMLSNRVAEHGDLIALRFQDKGFEQLAGIVLAGLGFEIQAGWDGHVLPPQLVGVVYDTIGDPVIQKVKSTQPEIRLLDYNAWTMSEVGKSALVPLEMHREWLKAGLGYGSYT